MGHFCRQCDEYVFVPGGIRGHECPPTFLVWHDTWHGGDDDGDRVYACDHESAATKWAEQDDASGAEYDIVKGHAVTVRVRRESNAADEKWFSVRGEAVPQYYADEAPRPACASSEPDTAPISTPDGQAAEPVVLENPAKQRGKLL